MIKLKNLIKESFYRSLEYNNQYIEIFKNPSSSEIKECLGSNKQIGLFLTERDVYIWDRDLAQHAIISRNFPELKNAIGTIVYFSTDKDVDVYVTDSTINTDWYQNPEVGKIIMNNPFFKTKNVLEISYFDENIVGKWDDLNEEIKEKFDGNVPKELYHVTTKNFIQSINKNGIIPNEKYSKFFDLFFKRNGVYLTDSPEMGIDYILYRGNGRLSLKDIAVFKIHTDKMDKSKFLIDEKMDKKVEFEDRKYRSFLYRDIIKPENFVLAWPKNMNESISPNKPFIILGMINDDLEIISVKVHKQDDNGHDYLLQMNSHYRKSQKKIPWRYKSKDNTIYFTENYSEKITDIIIEYLKSRYNIKNPNVSFYWENYFQTAHHIDESLKILNELKIQNLCGDKNYDSYYFIYYKGNLFLLNGINDVNKLKPYFGNHPAMKLPYHNPFEGTEDNDDIDGFLCDVSESFPDVIIGTYHVKDKSINLKNCNSDFSVVSSLNLKKIVKALRVKEVWNINEPIYNGDGQDYIDKRYDIEKIEGDIPKFVFHGTSFFNLKEILKKGITKKNTDDFRTNFKNVVHKKEIFFTSRFEDAIFYAFNSIDRDSKTKGNFPVILELIVPDKDLVKPDYDADIISTHKKYYGNTYPSWTKQTTDMKPMTLSRETGKWGYSGRIPPKFIKFVYAYSKESKKWIKFETGTLLSAIRRGENLYTRYHL